MAGSSNFQQFNPTQANQWTDAQYSADAVRASGAANPSIFPSETANKLFYQTSTFIKAMGDSLANKGYVVSDADVAVLAAVLANIMTAADMAPYAPLANPQLTGAPTAPTPAQGSADGHIANTYWTNTYFAQIAWVLANFAPLANAALTGGPTAPTPAPTDASNRLATTAFVKNQSYAPLSAFGASLGSTGFQRLPSGLLLQWGYIGGGSLTPGGAVAVSFPTPFQAGPWSITLTPDCTINGTTTAWFSAVNRSVTGFSMYQAPGTDFGSKGNHTWMAIGQ